MVDFIDGSIRNIITLQKVRCYIDSENFCSQIVSDSCGKCGTFTVIVNMEEKKKYVFFLTVMKGNLKCGKYGKIYYINIMWI